MLRRSRDIIQASMRWDCLLMPSVTLPPQPLDTILADTERVAEDDLAYIRSPIPSTSRDSRRSRCPWADDGLPMGVRLVGHLYGEASTMALAAQVERAAPWAAMYPAPLNDPSASAGTAMGQG